jgi:hypothetical protein
MSNDATPSVAGSNPAARTSLETTCLGRSRSCSPPNGSEVAGDWSQFSDSNGGPTVYKSTIARAAPFGSMRQRSGSVRVMKQVQFSRTARRRTKTKKNCQKVSKMFPATGLPKGTLFPPPAGHHEPSGQVDAVRIMGRRKRSPVACLSQATSLASSMDVTETLATDTRNPGQLLMRVPDAGRPERPVAMIDGSVQQMRR